VLSKYTQYRRWCTLCVRSVEGVTLGRWLDEKTTAVGAAHRLTIGVLARPLSALSAEAKKTQ